MQKSLKKYFAHYKNVRNFASVKQSELTYNYMHTMCGGRSEKSSIASHPNHHTCYTDSTNLTESRVRSFSTKIPTHGRNYKSVETVDNNMVSESETQRENNATMTLQVRNKTLLNLSFNQAKSLALLLFVRMYQNTNSRDAKDYTVNKLHEITHIHAETIKRRISFLEDMSLIGYSERKQIVFLKAKAHNPIHNTDIKIPYNASVKDIEKIILAVRLQMKIRQKEYLRNVLSIAREGFTSDGKPARLETIKRAKKWLREHCNIDWHKRGFVDYGWSYKAIAKYLGVSIKQVYEILKFAIRENFIVKHTHSMYKRITSKFELDYIQHTFLLNNYSYKVYSNTYSLGSVLPLESIR